MSENFFYIQIYDLGITGFIIVSIIIYLLLLYLLYIAFYLLRKCNKAIDIYLRKKGLKKENNKILYVPIFILILILFCGIFALPRFSIYYFLENEYSVEKRPELHKVPQKLEINIREGVTDYSNIRNNYFKCANPWGKYELKKIDRCKQYIFDEGINLIIFDKNFNCLYSNYTPFLTGDFSINQEYELMKYIYELTPENINYYLFLPQLKYNFTLLSIKGVSRPLKNTPYYFYESKKVKGFQFGNPETDKHVYLELYDKDYNYTIVISGEFTQSDINTLLFTIKFKEG